MLASNLRNKTSACSLRASTSFTASVHHHLPVYRPSKAVWGTAGGQRSQPLRVSEQNNNGAASNFNLEDYVQVKVESVKISQGSSVVFLRIQGESCQVIPVHIGEIESSALLKEINKQRQQRPLTHDVMKSILSHIDYRVTKIRITDIVSNTYYARIHVAKCLPSGVLTEEVDVDARPSDAINLAVRFGAPMYVSKKIAEGANVPSEAYSSQSETHADIARSVRETLSSFEDPTVMYTLQKEMAVQEQRFKDAQTFKEHINHEMTHNPQLRLVVAMEAALADGRYEEAARLRDEFKKMATIRSSERK